MSEPIILPKKTILSKYKAFFLIGLTATTFYLGDRFDISDKVSNLYNGIKNGMTDVMTENVAEAANAYLNELSDEKDLSTYSNDLTAVIYETTKCLDDSTKEIVIVDLIQELDSERQKSIIGTASKTAYANKKDFEGMVKQLYSYFKKNM